MILAHNQLLYRMWPLLLITHVVGSVAGLDAPTVTHTQDENGVLVRITNPVPNGRYRYVFRNSNAKGRMIQQVNTQGELLVKNCQASTLQVQYQDGNVESEVTTYSLKETSLQQPLLPKARYSRLIDKFAIYLNLPQEWYQKLEYFYVVHNRNSGQSEPKAVPADGVVESTECSDTRIEIYSTNPCGNMSEVLNVDLRRQMRASVGPEIDQGIPTVNGLSVRWWPPTGMYNLIKRYNYKLFDARSKQIAHGSTSKTTPTLMLKDGREVKLEVECETRCWNSTSPTVHFIDRMTYPAPVQPVVDEIITTQQELDVRVRQPEYGVDPMQYRVEVTSATGAFEPQVKTTTSGKVRFQVAKPVTVNIVAVGPNGKISPANRESMTVDDIVENPILSCPHGDTRSDLDFVNNCNCCQVEIARRDGVIHERKYTCLRDHTVCQDAPDETSVFKCKSTDLCSLVNATD